MKDREIQYPNCYSPEFEESKCDNCGYGYHQEDEEVDDNFWYRDDDVGIYGYDGDCI